MLAERLQKGADGKADIGVLNEGIIGNRLLYDSPKGTDNPFGAGLGQAGLTRFERDVLTQAGIKYVIVGLGINDILFPAFPFTPPSERVSAEDIISGYRQLIARGTSTRAFVSLGRQTRRLRILPSKDSWPLFILPRGKPYARRLTTGFAAVANSMAWSISMRSCGTQATRRNCFPHTIAETTYIPTMRVASRREMPFPLRCSRDDCQSHAACS